MSVAAAERRADLRERLIAATAEVIAEDGPLAVRVDEVARRAGCSRATVYRHVADKDELVREVLVGRSAAIAERLEAELDDDADPADWVVEGLLRHAEAVRAEPWYQALERQGAARRGGPARAAGPRRWSVSPRRSSAASSTASPPAARCAPTSPSSRPPSGSSAST